jgi:hypothetical protein
MILMHQDIGRRFKSLPVVHERIVGDLVLLATAALFNIDVACFALAVTVHPDEIASVQAIGACDRHGGEEYVRG